MIQWILTTARLRIALWAVEGIRMMRWLAILVATFAALSVLAAQLHYDHFAPRPTGPMPAVNVP